MSTRHQIILSDCRRLDKVGDGSVHLIVTSPPYYNAPFDYRGRFQSYEEYLGLLGDFARESFRVLAPGRIAAIVTDDMLVDGEKYPIVADTTRLFLESGFRYRDRITWRKPDGYVRISRRSGVLLQHPYPMYFYPDNVQESVLLFQKGRYSYPTPNPESRVNLDDYLNEKWYLSVWDITNQLPTRKNGYPAAFPLELPRRLITLFSNKGETVLDPFLGSGTTMLVAQQLGRNSVGYEVEESCLPFLADKLGLSAEDLATAPEIVINR